MNLSYLRRLLLIAGLTIAALPVCAQSMSDNQVIEYMKKEQEKGTSQQQIVTSLMKRGVTTDQLRRIRKKYQAEQQNLGASDLTGKNAGKSESRLRTERQQQGEQLQMRDQYMVQSQQRIQNRNYGTWQDRQNDMNDELSNFGLDFAADELQVRDENQVFGRNIFNNQMLTFQPNMNMATPTNYRLGAGDEVIIDVWGASQETFTETISPDGIVTIQALAHARLVV